MSSTMRITVNGASHELRRDAKVIDLMEGLNLDQRKVAIERNCGIVPRGLYDKTVLTEGDVLEIVGFIGGG